MTRPLIALVFLLVSVYLANAADTLQVEARLATNNILIGDIAALHVKVRHPAGAIVELPELSREQRIVVREIRPSEQKEPGLSRYTVFLTSFQPGSHTLAPTGQVSALVAGSNLLHAAFPEVTLRVESLLSDTNAALAGIKPPVRWKRPLPWRILWGAVAAAVAAALVAGGVIWWRRRAATIVLPPPIPPHERALQALQELLARQWIEQENVEPFYVELSGIARRYIEDRFGLRAPEQTTEEFIRSTASSPLLASEHRDLATSFLEQCDLVKFARHRPGAQDMQAAFASAERLVRETIPAAPEPSSEPSTP